MPAYDQVKVWTIDPSPTVRPRTPRPRPNADRRIFSAEDSTERSERNQRLWVWARLTVVAILGGAVLAWPYTRSCGLGLSTYLAATGMVSIGGLWVVACTWSQRMARAHALAMLVTLWGVGLIAVEVLPRVGYARISQPVSWFCGATARNAP